MATVVLGRASPAALRTAHARLATIAAAVDERARHLVALPDAADHTPEIEPGAAFALARGAASAAANLYAAAVELTPGSDRAARVGRLRGLARSLLAAGDPIAARDAAERAIDRTQGAARARLIADLSDVAWADGTMAREAARVREALDDADRDTRLDLRTALVAFGVTDHPAQAIHDADEAIRLVDAHVAPRRAGYLEVHREMASALAGRGVDWDRLDHGIRLENSAGNPAQPPSSPPLVLFTMCDRPAEARAGFAVEDEWYAARGEDGWRAERAGQLALVELRAGNTGLATRLADDACDRLDRLRVGGGWPLVYAWRSLVDAHLGREDRALATTGRLLQEVEPQTLWAAIVRSVAVMASAAAGDPEAAFDHAAHMREILDRLAVHDLLADRSEPLLAELRASAGDVTGAEGELARLEQRHASLPRPWTGISLARARAVVQAAQGHVEEALATMGDVDAAPGADLLPFERGWSLLVRGRLLRRVRDRRRAAAVLADARAVFDRLGAVRWVALADSECARVGLRRRPPDELTDSELAIARLAGQGLTTRQIADAAFVSPKTVEANLTRIYRKLDIGSRAELGAWVRTREGDAAKS